MALVIFLITGASRLTVGLINVEKFEFVINILKHDFFIKLFVQLSSRKPYPHDLGLYLSPKNLFGLYLLIRYISHIHVFA